MANYQDRVTTLRDILEMSPKQRRNEYGVRGVFADKDGNSIARHIDKVTINGNVFTDYSAFSFLWEKSYVKSPVRSGDGTIGNLNSYSTFLTPHLKIDFGLMSIDSYRKIMQLIYSSNEFLVTCYDVVNNKDTTNKMYFSTEEMPKLWTIVDALNGDENAVMLLGVQDYTVEMIGTNADKDTITINYYLNSPDGSGTTTPIGSFDTVVGGEIVLGADSNIGSYENYFEGYAFNGWRLGNSSGTLYSKDYGFSIQNWAVDTSSNSINFYADWVATNTYTLNYSYGVGTPKIGSDMLEITNKPIMFGEYLGELPNSESVVYVKYGEKDKEKQYPVYTWIGWYKTPIKAEGQEQLTASTPYWLLGSTTIYQLYDVASYQAKYMVDGKEYSTVDIEYGASIQMPKLIKSGYTFKQWDIVGQNGEKVVGNKMPPFAITLTAVFTEND
jgi:hypothetical protein